MAALPVDGTNPCAVLQNKTAPIGATSILTELYPSTTDLHWSAIANGGVLTEFKSAIAGLNTAGLLTDILTSPSPMSSYRLIQFLSGGGAAAADTTRDYTKLSDTLLFTQSGTTRTYTTIVDRLATALGLTPGTYRYPTTASSLFQGSTNSSKMWIVGDDTSTAPTSLIGKLMKDGFLLTQNNIFSTNADGTMNTNSLFYFYNLEEKGPISSAQLSLRNKLEATNLRFYGAFFVEYCYYKSRYDLLLAEYFRVYVQSSTGTGTNTYQKIIPSSPQYVLFSTSAGTENNYTDGLQPNYLSVLAYHLACVNTRLTDMRKVLDTVNSYYSGVFTTLQATINGNASTPASTAALKAAVGALQVSSTEANAYLKDEDFRKGVMEYTDEKNRYANILLGLYAFLNLSALAVIVYSM